MNVVPPGTQQGDTICGATYGSGYVLCGCIWMPEIETVAGDGAAGGCVGDNSKK